MVGSQTQLQQKFEDHLLNKGTSERSRAKQLHLFVMVARGLNKNYSSVTRADIEKYVAKLNRNKVLSKDGDPYSGSTKQDIKKFLRRFYKWYKGDNLRYPEHVAWIETRIAKEEKPQRRPYLTMDELHKVATKFSYPNYRFLTYVLWDSGFRIQEALSVKKTDLTWEDYDDKRKCWWIKCNESKTTVRKVPIPLFTEEIQRYLDTNDYHALTDDSCLFGKVAYDYYRQALAEYSQPFGKHITPHCLRHSSATYWANKIGNFTIFCNRFGWSLDSSEAKVYVHESGVDMKQTVKQVYSNEVSGLRSENKELRERMVELERHVKLLIASGVKKRKR